MATLSQQQHSILHLHNVAGHGMPHGLGLLTTVASLPPKYRSRYLNIKTKCEIPLDLSVKPESSSTQADGGESDVPIATSFAEVYTEPSPSSSSSPMQVDATEADANNAIREEAATATTTSTGRHPLQTSGVIVVAAEPAKPITPPPSPTKRTHADLSEGDEGECEGAEVDANPAKQPKRANENDEKPTTNKNNNDNNAVANVTGRRDVTTPTKPIRAPDTAPKTVKNHPPSARPSKNKATRKLKFDEETSSPVSGTIIRPLEDITAGEQQYSNGDIDPKYNIVEITEETKAELAAIRNVIGDYICRLCRIRFDDAFGLARHRCACIVLLEYRCPECGKQFNCPANLASHRRWHKPKKEGAQAGAASKKENRNTTNTAVAAATNTNSNANTKAKKAEELSHACGECGRKFKRQAYLRKHQLTHASKAPQVATTTTTTTTAAAALSSTSSLSSYNSYAGSVASTSRSTSSSSASSQHSYSGGQEDEGVYTVASAYDYDGDSMSECSNSSGGYGRLQIVESGLTEEENIAAAALTNLRNCASVIQHTTLAH